MNETQVKYLAGLLDADGSLSFDFKGAGNKSGFYLGLRLNLTASDAVDKRSFVASLPETTGIGIVQRSGANRQFAQWIVAKRSDLEMLLPRIIKHMVVKGAHWQWMLDKWRETRAGSPPVSEETRQAMTAASRASRIERAGPVRAKNHPTWAWLAGYLDGDGCYYYRRHWNKRDEKWQWVMNVSAVAHENDRAVLDFLQRTFGGAVVPQGQSPVVWIWRRSLGYQNRAFALRFLPKLARHSRLKRDKIDALIHHHRQRLSVPGTDRTFCTVEGCGKPAKGRGLCNAHYLREWKAERKVQATV